MKKFFTAVLIVTAFSISACGGGDEPAPRETVYVSEAPSQPSAGGDFTETEEEFLFDVASFMTDDLNSEPQVDVVAFGYAICDEFDEGFMLSDVVEATSGSGLDPYDVEVIGTAAAVNFCPEHNPSALDTPNAT